MTKEDLILQEIRLLNEKIDRITTDDLPSHLSTRQVSLYYEVSQRHLHRMKAQGRITPKQDGARLRWPVALLDEHFTRKTAENGN